MMHAATRLIALMKHWLTLPAWCVLLFAMMCAGIQLFYYTRCVWHTDFYMDADFHMDAGINSF